MLETLAISPSSDLVLDVVRAADPAAVRSASEKLAVGAPVAPQPAVAAGETFRAEFDRAGNTMPGAKVPAKDIPEAYRKFEAMVLQSFIKSMLPKDSEDVYGSGTAGGIWKSMMAQQIATVVADRGGIGIADRLLEGHLSTLGGRGVPRSTVSGDSLNMANSLVHQLQMKAFDATLSGEADDGAKSGAL